MAKVLKASKYIFELKISTDRTPKKSVLTDVWFLKFISSCKGRDEKFETSKSIYGVQNICRPDTEKVFLTVFSLVESISSCKRRDEKFESLKIHF